MTSTTKIRDFTDPGDYVIVVRVSNDDSLVAMCTNSGNVYIYNVSDGSEIPESPVNVGTGMSQGLAWSDDDSYLAVSDHDVMEILDTSDWTQATAFSGDAGLIRAADWYGNHLVFKSANYYEVYDTSDADPDNWTQETTLGPEDGFCAKFSPTGDYIALGGRGSVEIYDATDSNSANWNLVATLNDHTDDRRGIAWHPDETYLAIGEYDGVFIRIYTTTDWTQISDSPYNTAEYIVSLSWSPNGKYIQVGEGTGSYRIQNWDFTTHTQSEVFPDEHGNEWIQSLDFVSDGSSMYSVSNDDTGIEWDTSGWAPSVTSGSLLTTIIGGQYCLDGSGGHLNC